MTRWLDNNFKQQISLLNQQSLIVKTSNAKGNTVKAGNQTSSINADKWTNLMKQELLAATKENKSLNENIMKTTDDAAFQKYCDAMSAQQIKEENDFKNQAKAQTQLLIQSKDIKYSVTDSQDVSPVTTATKDNVPTSNKIFNDVSKQDTYNTNIKQQQTALNKKQAYVITDVNTNSLQSGDNIDSWISQAINQTGVEADWAPAIKWIINMESGGNPNAENPNSTAYGLMQLKDETWELCGSAKTSDPVQQIVAGIDYIKQRYGTAENAKTFWQQNNWY